MISITTNIDGVPETVGNMQAAQDRARHMKPAYQAIAQHVRNGVLRNFRREGWFPSRWQKSLAAIKRGGKTLTRTATLRNSYQTKGTDASAVVGSDVAYAAIHQFGGRCGRNHATLLPARPMFPVDAQGNLEPGILRRVKRIAEAWIVKGEHP